MKRARAYKLFEDGVFDARSVVGLDISTQPMVIRNEEVRVLLHELHVQMNAGTDTQTKIDRYMIYLCMLANEAPALQQLPWQRFVLDAKDVMGLHHLVDIGSAVRDMLMLSPCRNSIHRVLQYSMPYIKHNRLNFPAFDDMTGEDLAHMVRIVMACCLGCLRANTKRPVFDLRVKLYHFFYSLLATGSSADHYLFCMANQCLLRVAMIEYFIIFMQEFLPAEKSVICGIFQLSNDIDKLSHSFCLIFDIFRQTSMQVTDLNFPNINARAHIAIEKCNRVTKGKNRPMRAASTGLKLACGDDVLLAGLHTPLFAHPAYAAGLAAFADASWSHIQQVQAVQQIVSVRPLPALPANLVALQARAILHALNTNSNSLVHCTLLYMCLRCVSRSPKFVVNKKMRVMSDGSCYCPQCTCDTFIVPISILGRIVKIQGVYLYFCHLCCCTHEWDASGHEFTSCERGAAKSSCVHAQAKACVVCARTSSLSTWQVLDDQVGRLVDLCLCAKHKPLAHQQDSVYNLQTLRLAILHKLNRYRLSALEIKSF